jgi:hypothetical protein
MDVSDFSDRKAYRFCTPSPRVVYRSVDKFQASFGRLFGVCGVHPNHATSKDMPGLRLGDDVHLLAGLQSGVDSDTDTEFGDVNRGGLVQEHAGVRVQDESNRDHGVDSF